MNLFQKPALEFSNEDFESGQNSTILMRERPRRTKLEGCKKTKGVLLENSNHTITSLPAGRSQSTIISKRVIGRDVINQSCCSNCSLRAQTPIRSNNSSETEVASESEQPQSAIVQPAEKPSDQPEPINDSEPSTSNEQVKEKPALKSLKQVIWKRLQTKEKKKEIEKSSAKRTTKPIRLRRRRNKPSTRSRAQRRRTKAQKRENRIKQTAKIRQSNGRTSDTTR